MSLQETSVKDTESTGDAEETTITQASRTYTQEEFDSHMAKMKTSIARKYEKKFEELGDVEELRKIKSDYEKTRQEQALKRGEFDKVMQDLAAKKDAEIQKRDLIIQEYKINTPLLSAAAKFNAVNAEQVKALLAKQVKLNADGEVEVLDHTSAIRYNDKGTALTVDELVKEFLDQNPHFVQPTPSTTLSQSNVARTGAKFDVSKLNMKNPADRKRYQEAKANKLI